MLPSELYQQHLARPGFQEDPLQVNAIRQLDQLYLQLVSAKGLFTRKTPSKGLYLWGQVGIGKSFLVDLFVATLPPQSVTRLHYQHFMASIHRELNSITGIANPLQQVGKKLASQYRAICIDELYITDLGDAMILYQLFKSLFNEGVVLLITSNFAPEQLYRDDLQPAIFEPAITLIKTNTLELHLASKQDYRTLQTNNHQTWFIEGEQNFSVLFDALNQQHNNSSEYTADQINVQGHLLQPLRQNKQLVWFDFTELCELPRSAKDFIILGNRYKVFLLSNIPQFGNNPEQNLPATGTEDASIGGQRRQYSVNENAQRRFISLVDELYDQGIKLYLQAEVPLSNLYSGGRLAFEFQRTISRLTEMQSVNYRDKELRT